MPAVLPSPVGSIMQRLRTETMPLHQVAESTPFQSALMAGRLPREKFVRSLQQLLHVHRALEPLLAQWCKSDARIAAVVKDYQFHESRLLTDIAALGESLPDAGPLPATAALAAAVQAAAQCPLTLLGMHYVLEGSKNGGRFLAPHIREAYGLVGTAGTEYQAPYGDQQMKNWSAFKTAMDAVIDNDADGDTVLRGAETMFKGLTELFRALHPAN